MWRCFAMEPRFCLALILAIIISQVLTCNSIRDLMDPDNWATDIQQESADVDSVPTTTSWMKTAKTESSLREQNPGLATHPERRSNLDIIIPAAVYGPSTMPEPYPSPPPSEVPTLPSLSPPTSQDVSPSSPLPSMPLPPSPYEHEISPSAVPTSSPSPTEPIAPSTKPSMSLPPSPYEETPSPLPVSESSPQPTHPEGPQSPSLAPSPAFMPESSPPLEPSPIQPDDSSQSPEPTPMPSPPSPPSPALEASPSLLPPPWSLIPSQPPMPPGAALSPLKPSQAPLQPSAQPTIPDPTPSPGSPLPVYGSSQPPLSSPLPAPSAQPPAGPSPTPVYGSSPRPDAPPSPSPEPVGQSPSPPPVYGPVYGPTYPPPYASQQPLGSPIAPSGQPPVESSPAPVASPTPSPTPDASLTPSRMPDASPTPSPTTSASPTPSPTPDASPTPSPTTSASPTPSPRSLASPTPSPTSLASPTPSPTSLASPTPSPTSLASPTPSPTLSPTHSASVCLDTARCLTVNSTSGTVLDAYAISAAGWQSSSPDYPIVLFEFGIANFNGSYSAYRVRRRYSSTSEATIVGLSAGNPYLYVCVSSSNYSSVPVGPGTCMTVMMNINTKVSPQQVADQLSAMQLESNTIGTTAAMLEMAGRFVAISSAQNGTAVTALASSLLSRLVAASSAASDTSASITTVVETIGSLWSLASTETRTAVIAGVITMSEKTALQSLSAEYAQPIADFYSQIIAGAMDILAASAGGSNTASEARLLAARDLLTSITRCASALVSSLLNGAPLNGTGVYVHAPSLSTAVQRASVILASAGVSMSVWTPGSPPTSRRHLLSSPASIAISPAVGPLCAANATCESGGLGIQVTTYDDVALLVAALGGSPSALAANFQNYLVGGAVDIVSPIIRVAIKGLPMAAIGTPSLLVLGLPVNLTSAASNGANSIRALVRLQDFGAALVDPSVGITAATSVTRTLNTVSTAGIISGYSDSLGDFVVIQYVSAAYPTSGVETPTSGVENPTPSASPSSPVQAGSASPALPSALLTSVLGLATFSVFMLA